MPLENIQKVKLWLTPTKIHNVLQEIKSLARSGSLKLNKLMKPMVDISDGHSKAKEDGDSDHPSSLPLLISFHKKEKEHDENVNS